MRALHRLRLRLRSLLLRGRAERELGDELRFHLEQQIAENTQAGMPPHQAREAALRGFGGLRQVEDACRDTRRTGAWKGWLRDLRHGFRLFGKNPAFAAASICVLGLGIAAATAIFGAANEVLLRPLPFPQPERLVRLWDNFGSPGNLGPVSYPNFSDWRAWNRSFTGLAAFTERSYVLTGAGDPTPVETLAASASIFDVLGVKPALGRAFRPDEDQPGANGGADSAIISDRLWRARFGANPSVIGQRLGKLPFVVIGVMPPGFTTYTGSGETDVWITLAVIARPSAGMKLPLSASRGVSFLNVIGRLKPGVSLESARTDMTRVSALLMSNYPADNPREGVSMENLGQAVSEHLRPMLIALLWAAGALLAIACADISGLTLARVTRRQREISVRAAIGAGKWRLIRQLLAESLALSACGAALGVLLSGLFARFLILFLQLAPDRRLIAWPALAFAVAASLICAIAASLVPALHALRFDLIHGLKEAAVNVTASARQKRWQSVLVAAQLALAMVLLSACGLLALNLFHLQRQQLGFDPQHTFTFQVSVSATRFPQARRAQFLEDLVAHLRAIPGVRAASASSQMPLRGWTPRTVLDTVDGRAIDLGHRTGIVFSPVTSGFFETLGIPVKRGRAFTPSDDGSAPPVVVLNEAAARRYFGAKDPIGRQVTPEMWDGAGSITQPRTVIGVAGDVKLQWLGEKPIETVYWPVAQIPSETTYWIALRTAGDPLALAEAVRERLRQIDHDMPLYKASPLTAAVETSLVAPRYNMALIAFFAVLALALTAAGLYGTIAYSVSQRTHEIGIRIALGAGSNNVSRQFVRGGLIIGAIGVVIGLAFAKGATHIMQSLVFGASLDEPVTFAASAAILIGVALAASYFPARRAARIDPLRALRND